MLNVLITGGTGGIGSALSYAFIKNGYHVVCTHNNKSKSFLDNWLIEHELSSKEVTFLDLDITNTEETTQKLEQLLSKIQIDILINNAGITNDSTFLKMNYDQWHKVINTNLISLFSVTQVIARQMTLLKKGNIINISSINGLKGQYGQTNYSASKAGVIGFTKSLAQEFSQKGIRVNAICPGYTSTPMVENISLTILESIKKKIPVGNLAKPQEIAATALFIVQDMPSLTGETISINGGHYMS